MAAKKQLIKPGTKLKINKSAKPSDAEPSVIDDAGYRCPRCGHKYPKQAGNFTPSPSPLYKGNNGYIVFCRKCVGEMYRENVEFFDKEEDPAMERVCQIIDLCVDETAWDASRKIASNRNRFSGYISKLNLLQSNSDQTYSGTLIRRFEADVANAKTVADVENNDDITVQVDVIRRFGTGFDAGDYDSMQYEYQDWVERYGEPIDKRQEELYVSICYMKLNLQKLLQKGDANIGSASGSYKAQIEAATTEIEDRKKRTESEKQLSPIGEMIRDIEEYCPADFYKSKKLYADFDHLREYIDRFMIRPLRNLLTGSKELDKEFSLSDTEE